MNTIVNKLRILILKQVILKYTDEDNPLSKEQLFEKLMPDNNPDYNLNEKSLMNDIEVLIAAGTEICEKRGKHNTKLYYCNTWLFNLQELAIIIEAIKAYDKISKEDCHGCISKLKTLTSIHNAKKLGLVLLGIINFYILNSGV